MFQTTRRRLALWYTAVTALLLLIIATGVYFYVRNTLVERVDDTLNHVVEVVGRSLIIENTTPPHVNVEASFPNNAVALEDDHIDLEWFSPAGDRLWSTLSDNLAIVPLHPSMFGETVQIQRSSGAPLILRQITQAMGDRQLLGYLRVSEPWFEVTKPTRELVVDLGIGTVGMVAIVGAIGWLLSGLAMTPIRDSYQRLKQFTADASHELRNPVAVIQTNVQVAIADPDPQQQQQNLQVIERLTRRLGRLVDDLLFLARQDSGIVQVRTEWIAIEDLLEEVLEEQGMTAVDREIDLTMAIETKGVGILGDRDQISRLFTNLVDNALQYTPEKGKVHVELSKRNPAQILIKIIDTGAGIPEESIPQLFERFYRVDPARSKSSGGTGLGLAIARSIVENHQGQIQVESKVGTGTTILVMLPEAIGV
ncbi:MAG: GHKL domain-containing protein [Alkalinema sp. RU_4_3]|nr:GHKL domain-containing protein [Alkalinema sp. RU_4_3]